MSYAPYTRRRATNVPSSLQLSLPDRGHPVSGECQRMSASGCRVRSQEDNVQVTKNGISRNSVFRDAEVFASFKLPAKLEA